MTLALHLMRGMLIASAIVAAVFFAGFYRRSRDRFFAMFAAAFALLAINWLGAAMLDPFEEARKWVYVVRLAAFLLILAAIVDKNRGSRRGG